jgi:glucans biosynthesis protein C
MVTNSQPAERVRTDYIDWLRIFAVLLLIYFHTARIFDLLGPFYVKSANTSVALTVVILFLDVWHMHLFFLLSGAGTFFALGFRSGRQYSWERFKRIFIPFAFGTCVLIPPQGYYTLLSHADFHKTYLQYLPQFFAIDPKTAGGYRGTFEWGHLWFLLYLYTFSMVALPVFLYLKKPAGQKLVSRLAELVERPAGIFLAALPFMVLEIALRPHWPNGNQNLLDDWANFFTYISFFITGFILCAEPRFGKAIDRALKISLPAALVFMMALMFMYGLDFTQHRSYAPSYLAFTAFRSFTTWLWILALLGLARRFLNFSNRVLKYANPAAYPFYILHQTVIVIIGYYVLKLGLRVPLGYLIITTASLVGSILIYDLCIKRWNPVRFLFGMKKK